MTSNVVCTQLFTWTSFPLLYRQKYIYAYTPILVTQGLEQQSQIYVDFLSQMIGTVSVQTVRVSRLSWCNRVCLPLCSVSQGGQAEGASPVSGRVHREPLVWAQPWTTGERVAPSRGQGSPRRCAVRGWRIPQREVLPARLLSPISSCSGTGFCRNVLVFVFLLDGWQFFWWLHCTL